MKHFFSFACIASLFFGCAIPPTAELPLADQDTGASLTGPGIGDMEYLKQQRIQPKANFTYEYVLTPPREPDKVISLETVSLRENPWRTVENYLAEKGRVLPENELLSAVKEFCNKNNIGVPEWNINGKDHRRLQAGMKFSAESLSHYLNV